MCIMNSKLPKLGKEAIIPSWFPSLMQAFIFKNWNMVDKHRIAEVLETSVENVEYEASRMGLLPQGDVSVWIKKGYITIIRDNWHLLPYEQLLKLLGWTEEKLALVLKEDDFLGIKLGSAKPVCQKLVYSKLTEEQIKETQKIKIQMEDIIKNTPENARAPFDFAYSDLQNVSDEDFDKEKVALDNTWHISNETSDDFVSKAAERFTNTLKNRWGIDLCGDMKEISLSFLPMREEEYHEIIIEEEKIEIKAGALAGIIRALYRLEDLMNLLGGAYLPLGEFKRKPRFGSRYIYPFCGLYEQAFDVDSREYCPDELLEQYARVGVNGIWLQAILYRITEFPFAPEMSEGWQKRQKNLIDFIQRAKAYGIKIYLYINEPRGMSVEFYEKYPQFRGSIKGKSTCMCTASQEIKDYLKDAVKSLCSSVRGIGGIFTITMSENPTHCKSISYKVEKYCERCVDKKPWELVSEVNSIIADAAHSVDKSIKVIAWDWAWIKDAGFDEGDVEKCIGAMPKDVAVMCKRETNIIFSRGGVENFVVDYSVSVDGLSEDSLKAWNYAKNEGYETAAKVQVNNTWECSTTPYIPVYRKIFNQIKSLLDININHLMLSWTLGGYPSPTIKMLSEMFFIENDNTEVDFDKALKMLYGKKAEEIKKVSDIYCEAFSQFPFNIGVLYNGPQNGGPSNLLYYEPTGFSATMTCYTYDDLEKWRGIYPVDVLEKQYGLVCGKWKEGLELLTDKEGEFYDISFVSYSLFQSSYNQVRFVKLRNEFLENKSQVIRKELLEIIRNEKELAKEVYKIMCIRPEVGYEAANHYYFSLDSLKEKIINCNWLIDYYENMWC